MHNTVYVYDADKENRGPEGRTIPLWATWLGPPRPGGKNIDMWSTNDPEWGILGTPVVSDDRQTLFVVAWHGDGAEGFRFQLHALNLQNGTHRRPPVVIGLSSVDPSKPCRPQSPFNPCVHKQRSALLLSQGTLYVGFGGDGNRGALFAFDAQTLAQKAFWSPTPTGQDGGIWQSGQGPAADAEGNVYLMTGNGTFGAHNGGQNFGNSFVKLKLEGQNLVLKDSFTPCNFAFLNEKDLDLGSSGPVLIPGTPARIVGGGKEGVLYVLSATNMGKHVPSASAPDCQNGNVVQQVNAFAVQIHDGRTVYGNIHGSPVFWRGPDTARVYAWGENSQLKAFVFSQGRLQDVENAKKSAFRPPDGMPGGMLALSANGSKGGTGILWAVVPLDRRRESAARRQGHRAGARRTGRDPHALDERAVRAARSPRPVRKLQPAARRRRQGLRRDLWRRRAAADVSAEPRTASDRVSEELLRGGLRPAEADSAHAACGQPESRRCERRARGDGAARVRHEPVHAGRCRLGRLYRRADQGVGRAQPAPDRICGQSGCGGLRAAPGDDREQGYRSRQFVRDRVLERRGGGRQPGGARLGTLRPEGSAQGDRYRDPSQRRRGNAARVRGRGELSRQAIPAR